MKLGLISDTHIGITSEKSIRKTLRKLALEEFDVLIHAGDYNGGRKGYKAVRSTIKLMREVFPNKPILSVIGNHDFWYLNSHKASRPSVDKFHENYDKILEIFKDNNIHFLDKDGVYTHDDYPEIKIIGNSGWYSNPNPPTNDCNFLPVHLEGDTNKYLLNKAMKGLYQSMDQLDKTYNADKDKIVFVSHFPVVNTGDDYKGSFADFSWVCGVDNMMQDMYNCSYFLEGHSHKRHEGPLVYNCGSDYEQPKYLIVEIK